MPTIYEKCDGETPQMKMIAAMMEKYHIELANAGVTVECLLASNDRGDAVKLHGLPCFATIKVMSYKDRVAGTADARMVIDLDKWSDLHADERAALVDHELEHLEVVLDKKTNKLKTDDIGRPRLKCKPHDYEQGGFYSIVRRHKDASIEVKNYRSLACDQGGQMLIEFANAG